MATEPETPKTESKPAVEAAPAPQPGTTLTARTAGGSLADKVETIFATRIRGSRLSTDTELLNLVRVAFDDVKTLVAEHEAKPQSDL